MSTPTSALAALLAAVAATPAFSQVTLRASFSAVNAQGNGNTGPTVVSGDGRLVAFTSAASNLVTGDTNGLANDRIGRVIGTKEDLVRLGGIHAGECIRRDERRRLPPPQLRASRGAPR